MAQYCYKCGAEIRQVNEARRCECCGAHIYGQPDNLGAGTYASSFFYGGVAGLVGNTAKNIAYSSGTKSNKQIEKDYYESDYYRFTQEPLEKVFTDKGMIGEYALEGWIKQTQLESRVEYINGPFAILYNLMVPEPDGSFQEIDMVIITEYALFVVEIKNRSGKFEIKHWSDRQCFIGGEETYSPIMQNDAHCLALVHYLKSLSLDIDILGDVDIISLIATQPFMDFSSSYESDEYDEFVLSTPVFVSPFHCVTAHINYIIEERKKVVLGQKGSCIPANIQEIYNVLIKCCNPTIDRSLEMRFRDEYNENSLKHPWKYFKTLINGIDKTIVRENGVYKQVYIGSWQFDTDLPDYFILDDYLDKDEVTSVRELIELKRQIDEWAEWAIEDKTSDNNNVRVENNSGVDYDSGRGVDNYDKNNVNSSVNNMNINNTQNMYGNGQNIYNLYEESKKRDKREKIIVITVISVAAAIILGLIASFAIKNIARENAEKERIMNEQKQIEEERSNLTGAQKNTLDNAKENLYLKNASLERIKQEIKGKNSDASNLGEPKAFYSKDGQELFCLIESQKDKKYFSIWIVKGSPFSSRKDNFDSEEDFVKKYGEGVVFFE